MAIVCPAILLLFTKTNFVSAHFLLKMLAGGKSLEEVLDAYPELEADDVKQAMKYAAWVVSDQIHLLSTA